MWEALACRKRLKTTAWMRSPWQVGTDAQGHRSEPQGAPGVVCRADKGRTRKLLSEGVIKVLVWVSKMER